MCGSTRFHDSPDTRLETEPDKEILVIYTEEKGNCTKNPRLREYLDGYLDILVIRVSDIRLGLERHRVVTAIIQNKMVLTNNNITLKLE